ncbi:MAG: ArsA family ATPase, partial [Solirubrobacterales bacterium]
PGGVGKTTVSAAIGLAMAARGRKVAVLTIDPAMRLAESLGIELAGNRPSRISHPSLEGGEGELWAMMLDAKATFDDVVAHHAPDPEARDRILGNRIYQEISGALAGSHEYMAMEKLYEIAEGGEFDLLVLDTPPSRNALDFLDAPRKLVQFIEGRSLQLFLRPTGLGMKIIGRGSNVVFKLLNRLTGVDLLSDLSEFFGAMSGMIDGFKERSARVDELLADPGTGFVVVSGPGRTPVAEALFFRRRLREDGLNFDAAVVNRLHPDPFEGGKPPEADALPKPLRKEALAKRLAASARDLHALAERDRAGVERLRAELEGELVVMVPELADDVVDGAGLSEVAALLFAEAVDAVPRGQPDST